MSELFTPTNRPKDDSLPLVYLAGHIRTEDWQTTLGKQLLLSGFPMNVISPRRPNGTTRETSPLEDALWSQRYLRQALGGSGILAVNLTPYGNRDSRINEAYELTALGLAIANLPPDPSHNVLMRIAPGYTGNDDIIGALMAATDAPLIRDEAEFIAQILSRLPRSTRSTLS